MKKIFWFGLIGLLLFEVCNVYFIMPMPGSQQMNSIKLAYFLYHWRWFFRILFIAMIGIGFFRSSWKRKWLLLFPIGIVATIAYMTNFEMAADAIFYQPASIKMAGASTNKVDSNRLVIGVVNNGEAKAYPIRFIGYHHLLIDTIGNKPVLITYCTVCRTGRVYEPTVNGSQEQFRLVGMDHFNAMIEDVSTKSWWRQATGEAIAGKLSGNQLPEIFSTQTSLAQWLALNPRSLIMQADSSSINSYDTSMNYELGKSRKELTGTDTLSWKNKSWVIGIKPGNERRAYDWNKLKTNRIIQDLAGNTPVVLVLAKDGKSFFAFERPNQEAIFELKEDTLVLNKYHFKITGQGIDTSYSLKPIPAYQEFWHSWQTFNPITSKN